MHLEEIAFRAAGAHVLLLDPAWRRLSANLPVSANLVVSLDITLAPLPLPLRCPEFNPLENVAVHARHMLSTRN